MQQDPFDGADNAPAFKVSEAVREAVPALIALWGFSDSGKTYSSLRLARGLVGQKGKIALIDTENRRAKFYAGLFGGWLHIDMQPPFTPARYSAAFDAAIKAGAGVVIVDSMSHVWEGEGGVLEMADSSNAPGLLKWKNPKMAYKRMTNSLFRSPVHMIFNIRAKEKFVQEGAGKQATIRSAGYVPICDNRFVYEMTVAAHMEGGTHLPLAPVKIPEEIGHAVRPGDLITEKSGEIIAQWLAGGLPVDHETEALMTSARNVATEGTSKVRDWWQTLTKVQRKTLDPIKAELKDLADAADREQAEAARHIIEASNSPDPLDDPFTPKAATAA